jgi:hypothetical protein
MRKPVETALPAWLIPAESPVALREQQYATIFERMLEWVENGDTQSDFFAEDNRGIDIRLYRKWINRSPERVRRLQEAKKLGCEAIEDALLRIADGVELGDQDVRRQEVRINTRKWLMSVWNRDRYGESKKIDISQTIDIRANIEAARGRLVEGEAVQMIENSASESDE